jgi:hypothetical protein
MIRNDFYFWQDFGESANSEAFPGAFLASYQDASYPRVHRVQDQSSLQLILADNSCEWKGRAMYAHALSAS